MEDSMKFTATLAVVLISASMALAPQILAQQIKGPDANRPDMKAHSTVAPPPVGKASSDQLAKIEQQTARTAAKKPVVRHTSTTAAATPALDLGKNKPVRAGKTPQPGLPQSH
jgi:hypothetical protein